MHLRLGQELQQRSSVASAHADRVHAIFRSAARRNSGNFTILSRELLRNICVISTLHLNFLHSNALPTRQRGAMKFCGLRNVCWPCARKFCVHGAPKFREFSNSFARFRRTICVISTPDARVFGRQSTHGVVKSFEDVMRIGQRTLAKCTQFFVRGARRKFSRISQFFHAIWRRISNA